MKSVKELNREIEGLKTEITEIKSRIAHLWDFIRAVPVLVDYLDLEYKPPKYVNKSKKGGKK